MKSEKLEKTKIMLTEIRKHLEAVDNLTQEVYGLLDEPKMDRQRKPQVKVEWTEEEVDMICIRVSDGATYKEIGAEYNIHCSTVANKLKKYGLNNKNEAESFGKVIKKLKYGE